jgi:hypothetical protein
MARESISVDVSNNPGLLRLAEEVGRTGERRILRRDREALAVVMPVSAVTKRRSERRKTEADLEAFRSAAGGWKDVDTDSLIKQIYNDRRRSVRPNLEL